MVNHPLPADERPVDPTPLDTADLPPTPVRDRNIPASAWRQAPARLLELGDDLGAAPSHVPLDVPGDNPDDGPSGDPRGGTGEGPSGGPDGPEAMYKRRIGRWLLWRAGPASRGHARYYAVDADDLGVSFEFRLFPDGDGEGRGPSGATHTRFREWKKDLLAT